MDERARREQLVLALSDESINDIAVLMRNARQKLAARVSGQSEWEVTKLRQEIDRLSELLADFWDTRTEI